MTEKDDILNCIFKASREANLKMESSVINTEEWWNVIPVTEKVTTRSGNVTIKVTIELIENQEK